MSTAQFPTAITTQLFEVVSRLSTTITADITDSAESIPVASTAGFPDAGFVVIDNETIYYSALGANSLTCTGGRGFSGTAAAHTSGAQVKAAIVAEHFNRFRVELIAVQNKMGISGSTYTTTIDYMVHNLPTQGTTAEVSKLNAQYLGGYTSSQFLLSSATNINADKVDNIEGTTLAENAIEFTADAFNLNNANPATSVEIAGTSVAPRYKKIEFGATDQADMPAFTMPRTYNGGTVTMSLIYCSSTASSVFDIGIRTAIAGNGEAYNPAYGTAIYLGNITCSGTTGLQGITFKDIVGASLGLTNSKMNYIGLLAGTTCSVQIMKLGFTWNKG